MHYGESTSRPDLPAGEQRVGAEPETGAVEDFIEKIPAIVKESKAGYKTTEFWITVVTAILVVLNGIPLPERYEGFVVTALAALYAISRGLAKQGVPDVEPAEGAPEA
jgi:hypothetical protein